MRAAVVGAGPSGIYATVELLNRCTHACVDLYDRLPSPGGLVRFGVAPDHHDRRKLTAVYLRMALATGRFRYYGNVEIGNHVSAVELSDHYHAVVYAVGASDDRRLDVPGEHLRGVHAAADFVGWYNGHPDHTDSVFDFSGHRAVVIGNGNVALDVARILLSGADALRRTDIADHALTALATSAIEEVVIVGRRGPNQANYTASELISLGDLRATVHANVDDEGRVPSLGDATTYGSALKAKAMSDLLRSSDNANCVRRLVFQFLTSPVSILGTGHVEGVRFAANELHIGPDGAVVATATAERTTLATGLVFRSVGYRGRPLLGLPFDAVRAVIPSNQGRVRQPDSDSPLLGHYVTGWIKRGPGGVIGTNKACARETVAALVDDYDAGLLTAPERLDIAELVRARQPETVEMSDWSRIDRWEQRAGESIGRPRRKLVTVDEMLTVARLR